MARDRRSRGINKRSSPVVDPLKNPEAYIDTELANQAQRQLQFAKNIQKFICRIKQSSFTDN